MSVHSRLEAVLPCVVMTSEQQEHCWMSWQLVVNLTRAPVYL